jgi:hypothetical protein
MNGPLTSTLIIKDPVAASMIPGGASPEDMQKFSFVSAYVFYPSPGCWIIHSQLGPVHREVVVLIK